MHKKSIPSSLYYQIENSDRDAHWPQRLTLLDHTLNSLVILFLNIFLRLEKKIKYNIKERNFDNCFWRRNPPLRIAEAHSWTWTSGILLANCIAGVTMFILSRLFPRDKKICPSKTNEHEVSLFKSSAFAIFKVSLKYRLLKVS